MADVDPRASVSVKEDKQQLINEDCTQTSNQGKSHASQVSTNLTKTTRWDRPHFIHQCSIYQLPRVSIKTLMYLSFLKQF